jgi:hypothetical protein
MKNDVVMNNIQPVFIVGHPRSGTTLVQLLITAHPVFSSGPETHLFQYVLDPPVSDWGHSKLSQDELDLVFERLAGEPAIHLNEEFKARIKQQTGAEGLAPALLLHELMTYFASEASAGSAKRWVEKTPMHALCVSEILSLFPEAKIVNIVRDPRDVASSPPRFYNSKSALYRQKLCIERAESWNRIAGLSEQFASNKHIITVRYEDIVEDPLAALERIIVFLGEEYQPEGLKTFSKYYNVVVQPKEHVKKSLCAEGKIVNRRGIWKKRMSANEAKLVELICEPLMAEFGYTPEVSSGLSPSQKRNWLFFKKVMIAFGCGVCSATDALRSISRKVVWLPIRVAGKLMRMMSVF